MSTRFGFPHRSSCAAASFALMSCAAAFGTTWQFADTSGFSTLGLNSPTAVNFRGTGDLTMSRISPLGTGVTPGAATLTMNQTVGSLTNPDWVLGTRSYFNLAWGGGGGPGTGTVSYEFQFSGGLATSTNLVFVDFDVLENVRIKAYDASNNLISFGDFSILMSPGQDSTPRYQDVSWTASAGATGILANIAENSESNVIASLSSVTSIYRLVYEFDLDNVYAGPGASSSVRFNFAAAVSVPGAGGLAACVLLGLSRRRRR